MDVERALRESLAANDLTLWSASGACVVNVDEATRNLAASLVARGVARSPDAPGLREALAFIASVDPMQDGAAYLMSNAARTATSEPVPATGCTHRDLAGNPAHVAGCPDALAVAGEAPSPDAPGRRRGFADGNCRDETCPFFPARSPHTHIAPSPTSLDGEKVTSKSGVALSPDAPGPHAQPRPEATLIVKAIDALEQDSDQYGALSFLKAALRATTPSPDAPDPVETFGHPYRSPVVIDGHLYLHTSDCDWPARAASPDQQPSADPRPPYVLRLTGEQIGSITPPPEGDWFVDWDEYEDFVPRRMLDAALPASPDAPGLLAALDECAPSLAPDYPRYARWLRAKEAIRAALAASVDAPREGHRHTTEECGLVVHLRSTHYRDEPCNADPEWRCASESHPTKEPTGYEVGYEPECAEGTGS